MSVWFCIPSARPAAEAEAVLSKWRAQGYKIALWLDEWRSEPAANHCAVGPYPGYAMAVNALINDVMTVDLNAEWFVIGGDDVEPDPTKRADQIAAECREYFNPELNREWIVCKALSAPVMTAVGLEMPILRLTPDQADTFGVMQPTGDRWGEQDLHLGKRGSAYIDRVAGSAWIGREFVKRTYGGRGPLFEGYLHMFVDEELQAVAEKFGVFWQRRDLTQLHRHWARARQSAEDMPPHLARWNSEAHWNVSKALFETRKAAGFPGHEVK